MPLRIVEVTWPPARNAPANSNTAATTMAIITFMSDATICTPEADLVKFFHTIGIPLHEIYGLSETTGPATVTVM